MAKKIVVAGLIVAGLILLVWGGINLFSQNKVSSGALKIFSIPAATVFINDKHVGRTPYNQKQITVGEYEIKLVAESQEKEKEGVSWQTKIKINPDVLTVVNYQFGQDPLFSSFEILTLEKINYPDKTEIAVLSKPDGAKVFLDGEEKGVTPELIKDASPEEHELTLTAAGFSDKKVSLKAVGGYKLTVNAALAAVKKKEELETISLATPSAVLKTESKAEILETGLGYLRVRSGPSLSSSESGRVKPKEKYPFLEEKSGWVKIMLNDGTEGWVSSQYVKKEE